MTVGTYSFSGSIVLVEVGSPGELTAGTYDITAYGAQGGLGASSGFGGKGAMISGDVILTDGEWLEIVVGGAGAPGSGAGGGGGGSFVLAGSGESGPFETSLMIAGGGGGGTGFSHGGNGGSGTSGGTTVGGAGGINGLGGGAFTASNRKFLGGGGSGVNGDGVSAFMGGGGGVGFTGGAYAGANGGEGGFGGGGGGGYSGPGGFKYGGGGGGGYSGGGGGYYEGGGGGGSFASGTNQLLVAGQHTGNGLITFVPMLPPPGAPTIDPVGGVDSIVASGAETADQTITGTTDADTTVTLNFGGARTAVAATVTGTTWSYTLQPADIAALGQGAGKSIAATATGTGGPSAPVTSSPFGVDTISPGSPVFTSAAVTNVAAPTLTGTAETGSTVTLIVGGATYTAVASGGAWSIDLGTAMPDGGLLSLNVNGDNSVSVTATDSAGNVSAPATQTLAIDQTPPAPPAITSPALTDDVTPVISGTAEPGSTVTLIVGGATYTTVASGGAWSIDLGPADPDGGLLSLNVNSDNPVSVTATDPAGNVSAPAMQTLAIDTTAPTAPAIASVTDDVGSVTGSLTSGASTDDTDLTVAVSLSGTGAVAGDTVQLYDGTGTGTLLGVAHALSSGEITDGVADVQTGTLSDGTIYTITARVIDQAGNQSGASGSFAITEDTLAPTLAITCDMAQLKIGETAVITFHFSEDPGASFTWDGTSGDVLVTGGTLGAISSSGLTRTATFTPTAGTAAGAASITVASGLFTDTAGNTGGAGTTPTISIDTVAPTLAITSNVAQLTVGQTAVITFTFSEDPGPSFAWNGTTGDVLVTGGTLGAISGSGLTRTATFTPTAGTAAGAASITVASGTYTDTAGNTGGAGTTPAISIDTLAPTLAITSDVAQLKIGETALITFTFSEDPGASFTWNGSTGDVVVAGGTLGAISGSGLTRTATFTPTAGTASGTASITVASGTYTDTAGNTGGAGTTPAISIDTLAPTLAITSNVAQLTVGQTAVITFSFSEDPGPSFAWNGTTGDVVVTGGTLGAISGSGLTRTATFTPTAGTANGTASITVAPGLFTDAAGNDGGAGTTPAISIDTLAPTLAITSNVAQLKIGETAVITFSFSEDPGASFAWNGTIGDVVVSGGALGAISGSGLTRTATFTPTAGIASGTASITVAPGLFIDTAGNTGGGGTTPAISIDTLAPTLAITSDVAQLKIGETAVITFSFSEDPGGSFTWDGTTGDVVVTGGGLGAMSGSGLTRTATFTPTAGTASGTASITVAPGAYTDTAGNTGGAGTTPAISIDTLAPTLAITSNVAQLTVGQTATITFSFSEDPGPSFAWDGKSGDVALTGGTLGAISGSGVTRTATFTPTAGTPGGTASITVASGTYTDTAGNTGGAGTTPAISIDTLAPTLAITSNVAQLKIGETAVITFSFSEDPGASFAWDGSIGDVVVTGGILGAISGSGLTRTATFTPTAGSAAGAASITVASGAYTDTAGNTGGAGNTPTISIDTLAPTLAITSDLAQLTVGQTALITFSFSEDPGASFTWDGTTGDVVVIGGTLGAISSSGLTRTATFTPTAGTAAGAASITVASGLFTDAAGNTGGAGTTPAISIDTLAPTLAITSNVAQLKIGETAVITFSFSEDPGASFAWDGSIGDVVVTGGALGAISGSGLTRTATFTPTAGTPSGTASITVAAGAYTDTAGNTGGAGTTPAMSIDTLAPTLAITSDMAQLKIGETAVITFSFSEDPGASFAWDGTSGDVVVTGGTLGAISGSSVTRTATFTPTAGTASGTASITVAPGLFTDTAGNTGGAGTTPAISIDTLAPTLAITSNLAQLTVGQTATITFSFSEDPGPSFAWDGKSGDVALTGGTLGAISGSGVTRTATFTPTAGTPGGTASITVASGTYTDTAGNTGGAGTTPAISIDTLAPTLAITSNVTQLTVGQTAVITFTFSEDPGASFTWNGSTGDVMVSGGTLGTISGSGLTRTATFTPTAGTPSGTASIAVAPGAYTDTAGNIGGAGTTPTISIDTLAPTLAITSNVAQLTVGQTAVITFTFSEDPGPTFTWNGTSGDVVVIGGTLGAISGSGLTRTATFTPTAGTASGTASITVAPGLFADTVGNIGGAGSSPAISIDTVRPTATIAVADTALAAGETSQVTIVFSEAVSGFDITDLTVENGTLSAVASGDGGVTWTSTLTPTAGVTDTINQITLNNIGVADAAGNTGTGTTTSNNYAIDTMPPATPVITSPPLSDRAAPVIAGTAEAGSTVTVTVAGATYTTIATSGVWSIDLASAVPASGALAVNTNGANVVSVTATDLAGNMAAVPAAQILTITAPVIAGTVPNQGVPNQTLGHPFAAVSILDAAVGSNPMTVTLSSPGNGTLSNLSGGIYNAATGVYSVSGTPEALTVALRALVFTPIAQPNINVVTTGFTISVANGGAVNALTSVTAVQQILGLAAVPINQIVISVSSDGSTFAPAQPGMTNEAVVTNPVAGHTYPVPTGYQALFLGGTADATLSDAIVGNAYLVANSGSDTLIANAPNDILVAGSGNDSLFGGAFASTVAGGAGSATVFAGTGLMQVIQGSGTMVFGGNNNAGSSIFGGTGDNAGALSTNLTGEGQTVSVGSSAATVTVSGSGGNVIGGTSSLNVTVTGSGNSIHAGSGANTVFSGGSGNSIVGSSIAGAGSSEIFETGTNNTIQGGVNSMAVTTTGATQISGGSGTLTFVGGSGTSSVFGGTGATTVSAGTGGVVFQLGSSVTATANSGTGAVTVFGAAGATINLTGSSGKDYLVAGSGNETLNASASSSSNWLSVSTTVTSSSAMLVAGSGNDTLIAGSALGSSTMTGGGGSDAFVFFRQPVGGANDVITDFGVGDSVYIEGYAAGSAGALLSAASASSRGFTLTLSDSTTITFANLTNGASLIGKIQYG